MSTLNVASKADQAATLPAVLVAQYAKECDPNASINIKFEEVETLKSGDGANVELIIGSGTSIYGFEQVIRRLIETFPYLQGKNDKAVSREHNITMELAHSTYVRSKNGSLGQYLSSLQISNQ